MNKKNAKLVPFHSNQYFVPIERENNVVGTRLAEARKNLKMSCPALADVLSSMGIQVTRQAIQNWEHGNTIPNSYQLLAVCQALHIDDVLSFFTNQQPELDAIGLKKLHEYKMDLIASGRYKPDVASTTEPQTRTMLVSYLPVSAGVGAFLDGEGFEQIDVPINHIPDGADFGIRVSGDSMEPVYHDGQIVWVEKCQELNVGEVGIFVYDGDGYIKEYGEQIPGSAEAEFFTNSDGTVRMQPILVSYNKKYEPKLVSPSIAFQIVGRVLN